MHSNNISRIEKVAKGLGSINEEVVYVGGSVAEFYVIDSAKSDVRQTMDVDCVTHLKSDGHPVSHWYYGHFHRSWTSEIEGVLFSMLDIMEFKGVR